MKPISRITEGYNSWSEQHPALATLYESAALTGLCILAEEVARNRQISIGNGNEQTLREAAKRELVIMGLAHVAVIPIIEEYVYTKALPNKLAVIVDVSESRANLTADILFAASHYRPGVNSKKLPISQFVRSRHRSKVNKNRGLSYAVGAHMVTNAAYAIKFLYESKE